jgi:hypothetical protein
MKTTYGAAMMVSLALAGCPASQPPTATGPTAGGGAGPSPATDTPIGTATAAGTASADQPGPGPSLQGGWTVHVTSQSQSVKPDAVDTPEKKAKLLFDHFAQVQEGRVEVEHKTLTKRYPLQDEQKAVALDDVMTGTDWDKMKLRCSLEGAIDGGTIFTLVIDVRGKKVELQTGKVDAYPELKTIVETLKGVAGMP